MDDPEDDLELDQQRKRPSDTTGDSTRMETNESSPSEMIIPPRKRRADQPLLDFDENILLPNSNDLLPIPTARVSPI